MPIYKKQLHLLNLKVKYPHLAKEWISSINHLTPEQVTPGSHEIVLWQCSKVSTHQWHAVVKSRTRKNGSGCPYCNGKKVASNNCFANLYPNLLSEWHPNNIIKPTEVTSFSKQKILWTCNKCNFEWKTTIVHRTKGKTGCPACYGREVNNINTLLCKVPEIAGEWHPTKNELLTPNKIVAGSSKKVWWLCKNCNNEWETSVNNRTKPNGTNCPKCSNNYSKLEQYSEILFENKKFNQQLLLNNQIYQPDFKLSEDIFINVDGLYWHDIEAMEERGKDAKYHFDMRKAYNKENKSILQFYEDEIYNKSKIVKSIVWNKLGKITNKIGARKCKLRLVPHLESKIFFDTHHLMGYSNAKTIGLYYQNNLISAMSYKIWPSKDKIEIVRFGSIVMTNVIGGFSKLLSKLITLAIENNISTIESFCDLRYADGRSYELHGFIRHEPKIPGWCWTHNKKRYNRLMCKAYKDDNGNHITEKQHAKELGWIKIYDAGQAKYIKVIKMKNPP